MSSLPLAVETIGLSRRYGRRWALVNVDLRIARGATVMLAGRNGSGKSTLLRLLATAIRPDRGTIAINGLDSAEHREEVRRRGALLSHYSYLYEAFSALENLQTGARHSGRNGSRDELMPLLQRVGLEARADDPVATFSAGMRKRLSLARVLLQEPALLLLDEPYGQLDPPGFALIDRVIEEFRTKGATVLMATHQVERSAALCDSALLLEAGALVAAGAPAEIAERSLARSGDE
jgi:heme exporter protein A